MSPQPPQPDAPRTVPEDTTMNTRAPDPDLSTTPTPRSWVYHFDYLTGTGHIGYGYLKVPVPLTREEDEAHARAAITRGSGLNGFVITSLTLAWAEATAGQVIG